MRKAAFWEVLTWCVLALVMGLAIYRAKTQTIAHDEALEYEWFLNGSVEHVLQYNPANHMLFTLMAKPVVWTLGASEFNLRTPSLFGAAVYLAAAFFLCRRLFGTGILLFLSTALLCLNPQVLDFMSAARGYILGLAALLVAMCAMAWLLERGEFDPEDKAWQRGCALASIALSLPVVATPTNVIPTACLMLTFSVVVMGGFRGLLQFRDPKLKNFGKYFLAPGVAVGFGLLWPYAIQIRPSSFYAGLKSARDSLSDVFTSSFLYKWTDDIWAPSLGGVPPAAGSWQERVTTLGVWVFLPLLLCFVTAGLIFARRAANHTRSKERAQCQVFGGAAVASVGLIALLHVALRAHYPNARYCLFLVPLFTVGALLAGREIAVRFQSRSLRAAGVLLASLVAADYAVSIQVKEYRYNAYDTISLRLYQTIAEDAQRHGRKSVRIGGTWWYEPEINFYRIKFKANWMAEYDVKDKSYFWQSPGALEPSQYDYFVYIPASDPGLAGPRVRVVFRDEQRELTAVAIDK